MYRCSICSNCSKPRATRRLHIIRKPDGNVHRELPVCPGCGDALDAGVTIRDLLKDKARYTEVRSLPKPVQAPRPVLVGQPAKLFGQPIVVERPNPRANKKLDKPKGSTSMKYEDLPSEIRSIIPKNKFGAARKSNKNLILVQSSYDKTWDRYQFVNGRWNYVNPGTIIK